MTSSKSLAKGRLEQCTWQSRRRTVFLLPVEKRAIKQIAKDKIEDLSTFQNEIEILSQMDHPNIIKLYEYYETDITLYLVMEYRMFQVLRGGRALRLLGGEEAAFRRRGCQNHEASLLGRVVLSRIQDLPSVCSTVVET